MHRSGSLKREASGPAAASPRSTGRRPASAGRGSAPPPLRRCEILQLRCRLALRPNAELLILCPGVQYVAPRQPHAPRASPTALDRSTADSLARRSLLDAPAVADSIAGFAAGSMGGGDGSEDEYFSEDGEASGAVSVASGAWICWATRLRLRCLRGREPAQTHTHRRQRLTLRPNAHAAAGCGHEGDTFLTALRRRCSADPPVGITGASGSPVPEDFQVCARFDTLVLLGVG